MTIPLSPLDQTDEQVLVTARKLRYAYKMKRTLRYSTVRDFSVHSESVPEHKWALNYLSYYFLPLEDPKERISRVRVPLLITAHDMGEIPNGDKPYHTKTFADEAREHLDALEVFAALPESLGATLQAAWLEYEARATPEAKFVYALDKIEPLFELMDPVNEKSMKRLEFTYEQHTEKKLRATEHFPVMRRFVDVMSADMLKRDVFWKK